MFLVSLFRYLYGYVEFRVTGGFLERFLNLCNVNGLRLWDIRRDKDGITAFTDIKSYKKMHTYARRAGSVTKIVKKHGAPFLMHRYRHRVGLLVGLVVFAVVMAVLTSFIWTVEVEGNETLTTEQILSYYETQGLKKGTFRRSLDLSYLENKGMADIPELSWVSINLYGSKAVIELREGVDAPQRVDNKQPCNIKARVDGHIVWINVHDGYAAVQDGDSVVKGDLLVSAVNESEATGIAFYKHAEASVLARTEHVITEEIAGTEEVRTYTGEVKKRNYITFFNLKIPLGLLKPPEGQYELDEEDRDFKIGGTVLPISFHKREYKAYTAAQKKLTEEEIKQKAIDAMKEKIAADSFIQSVEQEAYHVEAGESGAVVTGTFVCIEEIGVQEAIEVENEADTQPPADK